jgi:hypothetical protein
MASPFSVFRRHQKVSLAVLGVAVMIGFIVFPAIIQMQQMATGNANNPVVLKWKGGQLTEAELAGKRHTRGSVLRFIQQLQEDARKADPEVQLNPSIGIPNTDDPNSIVQTLVLAEKARQMGIVVSDQAIRDYLSSLTEGVLTTGQMEAAKNKALGTKWTEEMLFDILREELLAHKLRQMASSAVAVTTPVAAWDYHNRMGRQVTAEFVPFSVDEFIPQVKAEPTNKEVQELYEKYKGNYPLPRSAEPGFKHWPKAEFEYFVADYSQFLQEEKAKVTREQIEQYYAENKNSFRIDEEPAEEPVVDPDDPRSAKPNPPVPPAEAAAPAGDATPPAGEPGVQGESGEAGEGATEADKPETPAEEPAAEKAEPELPAVDPKDETPPATTEPASGDDDLTAPPEKTPKYKPLAEVEESIRSQLAAEPAEKRMTAALDAAKAELRKYRDAVVLHQTDKSSPDPGKFDFQAVAKNLGLKSGETGAVDVLDLYNDKELELGQSYRLSESFRGSPQSVSFASLAYDDSVKLYYPIETQLSGREKVFLSWKIAEEKARIPELKEIRAEVVEAWKREEARKLAKAAAEKFAAEVAGDKSLKDQVPGDEKVLTPPPFTYFVPMSLFMFRFQGQPPELEAIQGIEDNSSDTIKKKVVSLPVGAVEVVENEDQSTYYVVRVASEGSIDEQRKNFMQSIVDSPFDGPPPELPYIGRFDQTAPLRDWTAQVNKDFGVEWIDKEYLERSADR